MPVIYILVLTVVLPFVGVMFFNFLDNQVAKIETKRLEQKKAVEHVEKIITSTQVEPEPPKKEEEPKKSKIKL